ncbi:hypothetical protein AAFF_G00135860 [Aldrovandia affinis]|uniref:Uncharacterized protein n=1 Tax=Aldrovandia affinis TaxID=143900 RepID=A0AAD7W9B7_9TELE|nr:hypothetical protein AAFF_G00135860 [Aldrovandia affinis]
MRDKRGVLYRADPGELHHCFSATNVTAASPSTSCSDRRFPRLIMKKSIPLSLFVGRLSFKGRGIITSVRGVITCVLLPFALPHSLIAEGITVLCCLLSGVQD